MQPKRGQIFAWKGDSYFAKLIRRFTDSEWTHVGWFLDEKTVLESDWSWTPSRRGVRYTPASEYLQYPDRIKIFDVPLPDDKIEEALKQAESMIGQPYDVTLIFSLAWALWWGVKCSEDMRDDQRAFICSELIARPLFDVAGFRFLPECYDIEATTPSDIHDVMTGLWNGEYR